MSIKIGVLDQSPIHEGETAAQALRNTIKLAQRVEELDFHAFGYRSIMIPSRLQVFAGGTHFSFAGTHRAYYNRFWRSYASAL